MVNDESLEERYVLVQGRCRQLKRGSVVAFTARFIEGDPSFKVNVPDEGLNEMDVDLGNGRKLKNGDVIRVYRFGGYCSVPKRIVVNGQEVYRSDYA